MAIVDVFDALVHQRVHKAPVPESDVVQMMRNVTGKHFDPKLFEVFIRILPAISQIREAIPEDRVDDRLEDAEDYFHNRLR